VISWFRHLRRRRARIEATDEFVEGFELSESDQHGESEASTGVEGRPLSVPPPLPPQDPVVAALCAPISAADPCGADLDATGDAEYLNFMAQVEGVLPTSFFSPEDGKPFDPSSIDLPEQIAPIDKLLARTSDIRLLAIRARLLVLNRDIAGFAQTLAAIAQWLDGFWDAVHPRPDGENLMARRTAVSALDLPTVVFPLQYCTLFEGRRVGPITYRSWIVANGEIKSRATDAAVSAATITESLASADPAAMAVARAHLAMLDTSVQRICRAFGTQGGSTILENLPAQLRKMRAFIDPQAADSAGAAPDPAAGDDPLRPHPASGEPGASLTSHADAKQALAAIAEYYGRSEPSSPALPLVRQAHQLIGKSFLEIMTILMPSHVDKAAFQIGTGQVFDLPVNKISFLSANPADVEVSVADGLAPSNSEHIAGRAYRAESRGQALALLESVQRYFRYTEPSSPVPMLCERARALAERDFMGVLEDVLPKSSLKAFDSNR
jgi:type VI secretion system protein ImpA